MNKQEQFIKLIDELKGEVLRPMFTPFGKLETAEQLVKQGEYSEAAILIGEVEAWIAKKS